jgi:Domain of unknown function (DUF4389)
MPERAKQRRWTVLLRAFLALPLAVTLLFVEIAAGVCVVVGWFAALAIGRAPTFVRTIVTLLLRITLRLGAYTMLLTDRFPPFTTGDQPDYGTSVAIPPATRLHRAAVLFRIILAIPASILLRVVSLGLSVIAFFMWLVVLVTGWLPKPVHEAYEAYLRYQLRFLAYFCLLVPTYPGELFGDLAPPETGFAPEGAWAHTPPPAVAANPAYPANPANPASRVVPAVPMAEMSSFASAVPATATGDPRRWMLVLGMGAKRLLVVVIVLGVVAAIGLAVLRISIQDHATLVQENNQLVSNVDEFTSTANKCQTLACLEQADGALSQKLGNFASDLMSADRAGVSEDVINQMIAAAKDTARVTAALSESGATSLTEYRLLADRLGVQESFAALSSAQERFAQAVNAARFG